MKGHRTNDGVWTNDYGPNNNWAADIHPGVPAIRDGDTRHPNGPGGADTGEIFLFNAPGTVVGVNNNSDIGPNPGDWSEIVFDMQYRTWVTFGVGGVRVSNPLDWGVAFTLNAQNGVWVRA